MKQTPETNLMFLSFIRREGITVIDKPDSGIVSDRAFRLFRFLFFQLADEKIQELVNDSVPEEILKSAYDSLKP